MARRPTLVRRVPCFHVRGEWMKARSSAAVLQQIFNRSMAMLLVAALGMLAACATSQPEPAPPPPSPFERAWNAALGAAQDEGVQVTSADRVSGVIRGSRGPQEVTINLRTQADGNVRVEMSTRGPKGADPGLTGRISRAYDRRMGR
jgi:hypothetical protein